VSGARLDTADSTGPAGTAGTAVRDLYWKPWDAPGCEHVRVTLKSETDDGAGDGADAEVLAADDEVLVADGLVLLYRDGRALRCHYRLAADALWRARALDLAVQSGGAALEERSLSLRGDGAGRWRVDGKRAAALAGGRDLLHQHPADSPPGAGRRRDRGHPRGLRSAARARAQAGRAELRLPAPARAVRRPLPLRKPRERLWRRSAG
jgi:hypothetical protein